MKKLTALIPVALVFTVACGQTDAGITTDVKTKLAADDTVKAYQIDVDTQDKIVTLSGNVDTIAAREQAVLVARQADGVRDVVDNLRVADAAATTGVDVDVDVDVDDDAERKARDAADSVGDASKEAGRSIGDTTKDAAKKTGNAAKRGAEAVADGAKKVGSAVKDAVTDDDPDTDKDGK